MTIGPVVSPRVPVRFWIIAVVSIVLAHALDGFAFSYIRVDNMYGDDFGRMLRVMGFVPLWIAVGAAIMLEDRTSLRRLHRSRGGLVIAGAIVGGMAAELSKLIVRRLRPGELGEYVFRPITERPFSTSGLSMPSSHALVAFGAAAVLSRLFPRGRIVFWALAWGCGLSRVAAGAHFLSDVVAAALIGWLVGVLVWQWRERGIIVARGESGQSAMGRKGMGESAIVA